MILIWGSEKCLWGSSVDGGLHGVIAQWFLALTTQFSFSIFFPLLLFFHCQRPPCCSHSLCFSSPDMNTHYFTLIIEYCNLLLVQHLTKYEWLLSIWKLKHAMRTLPPPTSGVTTWNQHLCPLRKNGYWTFLEYLHTSYLNSND